MIDLPHLDPHTHMNVEYTSCQLSDHWELHFVFSDTSQWHNILQTSSSDPEGVHENADLIHILVVHFHGDEKDSCEQGSFHVYHAIKTENHSTKLGTLLQHLGSDINLL